MRVVDITQWYSPTSGGIRTYLHAKAQWAAERGMPHAAIVTGTHPGSELIRDSEFLTVRGLTPTRRWDYRLAPSPINVMAALEQLDPGVIVVHDALCFPGSVARWAQRRNTPIALFCHSDLAVGTAGLTSNIGRVYGHILGRVQRRALRMISPVFVASTAVGDAIREQTTSDVVHVPLGIDLSDFHGAIPDPDLRSRLVAPGQKLAIHAGRLSSDKRVDLLVPMVAELGPDVVLAVAGQGAMRERLEREARESGVADRVTFLGHIADRRRLARTLATADLFRTPQSPRAVRPGAIRGPRRGRSQCTRRTVDRGGRLRPRLECDILPGVARLPKDGAGAGPEGSANPSTAPALRAEGLYKNYGATIGVAGVDLEVARRERFGFLGPNGAGKTTFIRLALGLLRPSRGRIEVMGFDVAEDRLAAAEQVGYLPGELGLIPNVSGRLTLDTLAALHPRPPVLREEILEVLELSAADLDRQVREYSRGMKQKLGLVAALQHDPPLMVLDEPTGGLDPVVQERLIDWLRSRCDAGRTLFFSSHVLSEVEQLCTRVGMIRDGELVRVTEVAALRESGGRMVRVTFSETVDPDRYAVPQISDLTVGAAEHHFVIHGDPGPLLRRLGALPVRDITIEPPRLEDLFRTTYTGEESP